MIVDPKEDLTIARAGEICRTGMELEQAEKMLDRMMRTSWSGNTEQQMRINRIINALHLVTALLSLLARGDSDGYQRMLEYFDQNESHRWWTRFRF